MSNTSDEMLTSKLNGLDSAGLKYIYGKLLLEIDTGSLMLSEDEVEERTEEEQEFLKSVAEALDIESSGSLSDERTGAIQFLVTIANLSPEYNLLIEQALSEYEQQATKLDFGLTAFAATILVVAIAAAIIKPKVVVEYDEKTTSDGGEKSVKVHVEAQGTEDVAEVIKAVLPFLG